MLWMGIILDTVTPVARVQGSAAPTAPGLHMRVHVRGVVFNLHNHIEEEMSLFSLFSMLSMSMLLPIPGHHKRSLPDTLCGL